MAMINCPRCRKRISEQAPFCRHCSYKKGTDPHKAKRKNFSLHYLGATLLAVGCASIYFTEITTGAVNDTALALAPYGFGLAIAWYVGIRIWSWMR